MRIVAGAWRGRSLSAPPGHATRPTADRVRQALFDRLAHAPWAGPTGVQDVRVLDAFAGTGALGLEALSRGARRAWFMEHDRAALETLRANIAACRAGTSAVVLAVDCLRPPDGTACELVFLDPPYGHGLIEPAMRALQETGWITPTALIVAETGRGEDLPELGRLLDDRCHGKARITIWRRAG